MSETPKRTKIQSITNILTLAARLSFAVTVVLIPVRYRWIILERPMSPVYNDYTNLLIFFVDIAMYATLFFWSSSLLLSKRKLIPGPRHMWIPLSGLMVAGWLSVITSLDPLLSIYHSIRLLLLFWFYLFIINEIHSAVWVLIPVGLQVVIQSVVAVGQSLTQHAIGLQNLGEHILDTTVSGTSILTSDGIRLLRAYGLSDHPNILGGSLAFCMILLLSVYLYNPKPIPVLSAFLPGLQALLVTFSRSAWLAFMSGAFFIIGVTIKRRHWESLRRLPWLILMSGLLLLPFVFLYSRFLGSRINADNSFNTPSVEQQSIGERFLLIDSYGAIFKEHPALGVGLGVAPQALEISYPIFPVGYEPPHIAILDVALETGLVGAAFYIALIIGPIIIFLKERKPILSSPMTSTVFALLLTITVVGFFDYYTWYLIPGRLWQWLAWGLWGVTYQKTSTVSPTTDILSV